MLTARSSGTRAARGRSPSERAKPSASSSSWPGVRIVTATGVPPIRSSSGSSTATRSSHSSRPGRRSTRTAEVLYAGGASCFRVIVHATVAAKRAATVDGAYPVRTR